MAGEFLKGQVQGWAQWPWWKVVAQQGLRSLVLVWAQEEGSSLRSEGHRSGQGVLREGQAHAPRYLWDRDHLEALLEVSGFFQNPWEGDS